MKKLLLICLLFLGLAAKAQDTLSIGQYGYTVYDDTVTAGTVDSVSFWLVHHGANGVFDTVYIVTEVMDSSGTFSFNAVDTSMFAVAIPVNDSVKLTTYPNYSVSPSPASYHYDINVIVIWPYGINFSGGDSLFYNVFITLADGINELDPFYILSAYPNPVSENLQIRNPADLDLEEVRIYDNYGRLVLTADPHSCIRVDHLSKGIYILDLRLKDGRVRRVRIIRQ